MNLDNVNLEIATSRKRIEELCDIADNAELYSSGGMFKSFYNNPDIIEKIILAKLDEKYIGSTVLLYESVLSGAGMVNYGVYVHPKYRLRGVGRLLTNKLTSLTKKQIRFYQGKPTIGFFEKVLLNQTVATS
jgi:GNAT superfamily N-acetyltransferase